MKISYGLFILLFVLMLSGFASAGYYYPSYHDDNYYNTYQNTYYGSRFPCFYDGCNGYHNMPQKPIVVNTYNNYYSSYYTFNVEYNQIISYRSAPSCENYPIGSQCSRAYHPYILYSIN